MVSFWNITSDKLSQLEISPDEEKIIFVSDTERIFTDYDGVRTEYRSIIYVQNINDIAKKDAGKNSLYFEISTKKIYFYANDSYYLLNPDPESITYIGRYTEDIEITTSLLDRFVKERKGRDSKINDLVVDYNYNQWLKVDNKGDGSDWETIGRSNSGAGNFSGINASYTEKGLVSIKENCGLIIKNGILSLNLLDETRAPGQIVILNDEGKIDTDIYDSGVIQWQIL